MHDPDFTRYTNDLGLMYFHLWLRKLEMSGKAVFMQFCLESTIIAGAGSIPNPLHTPSIGGTTGGKPGRSSSPSIPQSITNLSNTLMVPKKLNNAKMAMLKSETMVNNGNIKSQKLALIGELSEGLKKARNEGDTEMLSFYETELQKAKIEFSRI